MKRVHKRYSAFLIVLACLMIGFLFGPAAGFNAFAAALGFAFGTYVGGQSATDYKNGEGSFKKE